MRLRRFHRLFHRLLLRLGRRQRRLWSKDLATKDKPSFRNFQSPNSHQLYPECKSLPHRLDFLTTSIFKFQKWLKLLWNWERGGSPFLEIVHNMSEVFCHFFLVASLGKWFIEFWICWILNVLDSAFTEFCIYCFDIFCFYIYSLGIKCFDIYWWYNILILYVLSSKYIDEIGIFP